MTHHGTLRPRSDPMTVPVAGLWSDGDAFLVEAQMTGSERYAKGGWRYERVEHANHWLPLHGFARVNPPLTKLLH